MARKGDPSWDEVPESRGGSKIIRHEHNDKTLRRPLSPMSPNTLSEKDMDSISDHLEHHIGKVESVFHEIMSDDLHIDVNFVKPSKKCSHNFLCTMGMSALSMKVPKGYDGPTHAELCIYLPSNWPLSQQAFEKFGEDAYWPVRWLKSLSRLPNDFDTFLGPGHTIPNGDPPEGLSRKCKFVGFAIMPDFNDDFRELSVGKRKITFFALMPLFAREMRVKLDQGMEALLERFEASGVDPMDLANPKRPCVA